MKKNKWFWISVLGVLLVSIIFFVKIMIIDITKWREDESSGPNKYVCLDGSEVEDLSDCKQIRKEQRF